MIVVEMNITIIAASVVVMRPCFKAIFEFFSSLRANRNAPSQGESVNTEPTSQDIRVVRVFDLASENDSKEHILLANL